MSLKGKTKFKSQQLNEPVTNAWKRACSTLVQVIQGVEQCW